MRPDQVTWEAEYADGTVVRETSGAVYDHLDRSQIRAFRLVAPGEIIAELRMRNGAALAYRRRTYMRPGAQEVWFVLGMVPRGPVVAYQPDSDQLVKGAAFDATAGPLGRPQALPFEHWSYTSHATDAVLRVSQVRLPSGYVLNV